MSNRLYLLKQAKYIQDTYGEDTVATIFAKEVEEYLHSLQIINSSTQTVRDLSKAPLNLSIEKDASFTWKAKNV